MRAQQPGDALPPTFTASKTIMHRRRREHMPALAQRIVDIDLQGVWSTTLQGAPFVLHQDARMILFATDRNLEVSLMFPAI